MAATHTGSTLQAAISLAAGGTQTSSTLNLTTAYGAIVTAQITNGATAPTAACSVTINVSIDGTTFVQWAQGTAGLGVSTAYPFAFTIDPATMYVQAVFTGNTGQAVTVAAQAQALTGL